MIAPHGHQIHVLLTVVVVIPDRHPHAVTADVQARTGGDVAQVAVALVVIRGGGGGPPALGNVAGPVGRTDEEQIGRAVVVEVEEGDPSAHGFGQQFVAVGAVVVDKADACLLRNVREPDIGDLGFGFVR